MNAKHITPKSSPLAIALACVLGLGISASTASAQYIDVDLDVIGDQPVEELFMGQTTYSQEAGTAQMSLSGGHFWSQDNSDMRFSEIRGRAEYGVTDRLEAHADFPMQIVDSEVSGMTAETNVSSIALGAQYSLTTMSDPIALSAGLDVDIPLGQQQDLSSSRINSGLTLVKPSLMAGKDFGEVEVHADAQAELGGSVQALNSNIGAVYSIGRVAPTLELNSRAVENATPQFYATPGLYYNFSDRAELGLGVPIGLNDVSRPVGVMAKFSFQLR